MGLQISGRTNAATFSIPDLKTLALPPEPHEDP